MYRTGEKGGRSRRERDFDEQTARIRFVDPCARKSSSRRAIERGTRLRRGKKETPVIHLTFKISGDLRKINTLARGPIESLFRVTHDLGDFDYHPLLMFKRPSLLKLFVQIIKNCSLMLISVIEIEFYLLLIQFQLLSPLP